MPLDDTLRLQQRGAMWILAIDGLYARRPDLAGVYAPADIALESVRFSA